MSRLEFRRLRLRLGLTQMELAHVLGINRNTVTRLETGGIVLPRIAGWAIRGVFADKGRAVSRSARS